MTIIRNDLLTRKCKSVLLIHNEIVIWRIRCCTPPKCKIVCSDQDHVKTSNFRESTNIMLNVKVLLFTIYFNTRLTDLSMLTFKKVLTWFDIICKMHRRKTTRKCQRFKLHLLTVDREPRALRLTLSFYQSARDFVDFFCLIDYQ